MNLFLITLESVAILLGIGIIGVLIIRTRILPRTLLSSLSPLALDIALPSLIFVDIIKDFTPAKYPLWWQYPLWWMFFTVFAFLVTMLLRYSVQKKHRSEFSLSLFYQNGIFFPLAILAGMFPESTTYIISLFMFTIFYPAFFFSTYPFFFSNTQREKIHVSWRKIAHSTLFATLIALIIGLFGMQMLVPNLIISIFSTLGVMTVPLLMIILGGNIYINYQKQGITDVSETIIFVLSKNIIFPLIFIGLLYLMKSSIPPTVSFIILLQSAVPPVTAVPLVTERMNGNHSLVSQFTVASFLFSLLSIPTMVYLYGLLFPF